MNMSMSMVVKAAHGLSGYSSYQHQGGNRNLGKTFDTYLNNAMSRVNAQPDDIGDDERGGIKRILRDMKREANHVRSNAGYDSSAIMTSQNYLDTLRAGRQKAKNTSLSMKKLKYHFKSISSKILRAKTSSSCRQVVGQARREIVRLQRARQNDGTSEELEAAISHAKSMERIARKKMKHLQEEEMAKASGGICADREIELEEQSEALESEEDTSNVGRRNYWEELEQEDTLAEDMSYEDLSAYIESIESVVAAYESETDMLSVDQLTEDMMAAMSEEMRDMMEELGLDELNDSLMAIKGDMDPADLKEMIVKHRNKEMKEIVKADADYLKVVFKQMETMSSETTPTIDVAL